MQVKQKFINGILYDIVSPEDFYKSYNLNSNIPQKTLVEMGDYLYEPVGFKNFKRNAPYVQVSNVAMKFHDNGYAKEYRNKGVIDFNKVKTMKDFIQNQNKLKNTGFVLTDNNKNAFTPVIDEERDSPTLQVLKKGVQKKNADIDAYRNRFRNQSDFSNTMRLLSNPKNHSISIAKLKSIADKLDIKVKITLEDASPDVINPMGTKIEGEI